MPNRIVSPTKARIVRVARISLVGFLFAVVLSLAYVRLAQRGPEYTLREALWVSDRDMKTFHPPLSPESQSIIEILKDKGFATDKKEYQTYVLYRGGLSTNDAPGKTLLIFGFQPPANPHPPKPTLPSQR